MKTIRLLTALLLLAPFGAQADLLLSLDTPDLSGLAGDVLSFTGVITNPDLDPTNMVYLNSFDLNFAGDDFTIDGTDDFNNVPFFLTGGATSGDIELFTVSIDNPLIDSPGTWDGVYTLVGGGDANAQDILGLVDFSVTTLSSSTPEPSAFVLCGLGIVLPGVRRRFFVSSRRRTARALDF
jgi:hypothetical protein